MTLIHTPITLPAYTTAGFQGHMVIVRNTNTTFDLPKLNGTRLLDGTWTLRGQNALEVDGAFLKGDVSHLIIDGVPAPLHDHTGIPAGASVALHIHPEDLPFQGSMFITLITVRPDGDWQKEHVWPVTTPSLVTFRATHQRFPGAVIVYLHACPEQTVSATATTENETQTELWTDLRDAIDQSKAFIFTLPEDTLSVLLTVLDADGNEGSLVLNIPPLVSTPPQVTQWELPHWFPQVEGNKHLLDALSSILQDPQVMLQNLNPTQATDGFLDVHGAMQGLKRFAGESDQQFRNRVLAVPRGNFVTPEGLEKHLSALAGVPVRVKDRQTAFQQTTPPKLDGTRLLDGSWRLGGDEGTKLNAGEFVVIFEGTPRVPLQWITHELNRLRLAGTEPILVMEHPREIRPFSTLLGAHIQNLKRSQSLFENWVVSDTANETTLDP